MPKRLLAFWMLLALGSLHFPSSAEAGCLDAWTTIKDAPSLRRLWGKIRGYRYTATKDNLPDWLSKDDLAHIPTAGKLALAVQKGIREEFKKAGYNPFPSPDRYQEIIEVELTYPDTELLGFQEFPTSRKVRAKILKTLRGYVAPDDSTDTLNPYTVFLDSGTIQLKEDYVNGPLLFFRDLNSIPSYSPIDSLWNISPQKLIGAYVTIRYIPPSFDLAIESLAPAQWTGLVSQVERDGQTLVLTIGGDVVRFRSNSHYTVQGLVPTPKPTLR